MKRPLNAVVIAGLLLGGIFGMAGTFVADPKLRAVFWAIDGLGLIVATAILSLKHFRAGDDAVAAGFLIYSIGESVMAGGPYLKRVENEGAPCLAETWVSRS